MKHFAAVLLSVFLLGLPVGASAIQNQPTLAQPSPASAPASIIVPAGTKVELVVTRPEWAQSAKDGDIVYAQTSFPVVAAGAMAIPAGTYVEGTIESVTRPTRKLDRAEIQVLFTKIVFADGYTLDLPGPDLPGPDLPGPDLSGTDLPGPDLPRATSARQAPAADFPAATNSTSGDPQPAPGETLIAITVQVTTANDLLLDNGAEIEMALGAPLELDAKQVAQSIPLSRVPEPGQLQSATLCRNTPATPGTPGTPDTVIPGSPGTPSTTIPGGPGMPDITIPRTPATPDTVIPGSPGTPGDSGYVCPSKPLVISCAPVNNQPTSSQPVAAR